MMKSNDNKKRKEKKMRNLNEKLDGMHFPIYPLAAKIAYLDLMDKLKTYE